jgi:replicative superfamily II helicase
MLIETELHVVGSDPRDLGKYGLGEHVISALRAHLSGTASEDAMLNALQLRAIAQGVLTGKKNMVIAAPTSSGKTLIGELAVLTTHRRGLKSIVLLPTRALTDEKWEEFDRAFGPVGLRAVRSFGGANDDDGRIKNNDFDVAFLTYEKFAMLAFTRPSLLAAVGLVVVDETHMIADEGRGRTVELLLTMLRDRQRQHDAPQIIALSAALGDLSGFPEWLNFAELVVEPADARPVPLEERVVAPSGTYYWCDGETHEVKSGIAFTEPAQLDMAQSDPFWADTNIRTRVAAAVIRELAGNGEQLLIFCSLRRSVIALAKLVAEQLGLPPADKALARLGESGIARDPCRASDVLVKTLEDGVGLHVSDLDQAERRGVEGAFRDREFRVLVATSGLAMGVNTPATTVIVAHHRHYRGKWVDYAVAEYKNMAGRAGRWIRGVSKGVSYLIATSDWEAQELLRKYVLGVPERLISRLDVIGTEDLTLALLALSGRTTPQRLDQLVRSTFYGYQHADDAAWRRERAVEMAAAIEVLEEAGFLKRHEDGTVSATEYGRIAGRGGISFASALEIRTAAESLVAVGEPIDELALVALIQLTNELHELHTPCNWDEESQWSTAVAQALKGRQSMLRALGAGPDYKVRTGRLKRLYSILMWLQNRPIQAIDDRFSKHYQSGEPAAAAIRSAASRTSDLLPSVGAILASRFPERADEILKRAVELRPRLEIGVGRKAAALIRARLGLSRAAATALEQLGITSPEELHTAIVAKRREVMGLLTSLGAAHVLAAIERRLSARGTQVQAIEAQLQLQLLRDLGSLDEL